MEEREDNIIAGTKEGAQKARDTNIKKYGKDFYKKMGAKGGAKSGIPKGFGTNHKLAVESGRKGGLISKRGPIKKDTDVQ